MDGGRPVQPSLFGVLEARGCEMLTPVFDGLLRIMEAALGRSITAGALGACSADEALLLKLLAGPARLQPCEGAGAVLSRTFGGALRSARVMLRLTLQSHGAAVMSNATHSH